MTHETTKPKFRLAAIDLDGTLLGPDLKISPENLHGLRVLQEHQIEIVIASGRHYLSVQQFLKSLPEVQWIVSVQGGEISDRARKLVLERTLMERAHAELALEQAIQFGFSTIVYGVDGVFTHLPKDEHLAFYQSLSGLAPVQIARGNLTQMQVFKVLWLGTPDEIAAIMAHAAPSTAFERVQTHSRIIEFMPHNVTKATGLQCLATHLGISANDIVVFGDADNDIPMFKWAGLSVAMSHGWPTAIEHATMVSPPGPPESALARAISAVLSD